MIVTTDLSAGRSGADNREHCIVCGREEQLGDYKGENNQRVSVTALIAESHYVIRRRAE